MTFNAPPPPPSPEFQPEPTPPQKGKRKGILIGVLVVLLLALVAVAAFWFLNQKDGETSAVKSAAPVSSESVAASQEPSASASVNPTESAKPSSSKPAAATAGKWTKKATESPTTSPSEPSETSTAQPSEDTSFFSSARQEELTSEYCTAGKIILYAQTAKHYVSICQNGSDLTYRGVGKSSGNPITLAAIDMGGGHYQATNSSSNTTTYDISQESLKVTTTNSGVILDSSVTGYENFN